MGEDALRAPLREEGEEVDVIALSVPPEHCHFSACAPPPFGCGGPIDEFRDDDAFDRWTQTGLCQFCQDAADNVEDE